MSDTLLTTESQAEQIKIIYEAWDRFSEAQTILDTVVNQAAIDAAIAELIKTHPLYLKESEAIYQYGEDEWWELEQAGKLPTYPWNDPTNTIEDAWTAWRDFLKATTLHSRSYAYMKAKDAMGALVSYHPDYNVDYDNFE